MRVVIVHNPTAGDSQHDQASLLRLLSACGHDAAYFSSKDGGWRDAVDESVDLVAIAGGDGTVEQVVRRLLPTRQPLAVLPLGTANNISTVLGIADTPVEQLVAGWHDAREQPFDVGVATGPWGTRRFVESVGAGLLADGMVEIRRGRAQHVDRIDDPEVRLAEAADVFETMLAKMRPVAFQVTLDGEDRSGEFVMVEVLNLGAAGPNLRLSQDADLADGLLDVVLVDHRSRMDLAEHLRLSRRDDARAPALPIYKARHVELSGGAFTVHIDDALQSALDPDRPSAAIEMHVERHAVTFLVPRAAPAVAGNPQ